MPIYLVYGVMFFILSDMWVLVALCTWLGFYLDRFFNEIDFVDNPCDDVINALQRKNSHIPYRNSKLTQSFVEGDFDRPVCSYDIWSPEIIVIIKLELNSLKFPDMCAKETHSCLLKSHFENVSSSSLDCSSLHWIVLFSTIY
nr:hypothetical protein [Tanacetum cinerariifolium]